MEDQSICDLFFFLGKRDKLVKFHWCYRNTLSKLCNSAISRRTINFIYLLTSGVYVTTDQAMANSQAKEVDLLVTWLFTLTQDYYNYKMAAVIGIMVFIVTAVISLVVYQTLPSVKDEEGFQ